MRSRNRILASIAALMGLGAASQLDAGPVRAEPLAYGDRPGRGGAFGARKGGRRKSQGKRRGRGRR